MGTSVDYQEKGECLVWNNTETVPIPVLFSSPLGVLFTCLPPVAIP